MFFVVVCLNRGLLFIGMILLMNFVFGDNELRWFIDDIYFKVLLRFCMSDDFCEMLGFNIFCKERVIEEVVFF